MREKKVISGKEAREKLLIGVDIIANAVGSTLGGQGRTVLMESEQHIGGVTSTKDGVSVAKNIVLEDPVENLACTVLKNASSRTASEAGDGTTTTMVLAQAIIHNANDSITDKDNVIQVIREIEKCGERVLIMLDDMAKPLSDDLMLSIATVSANGDTEIGKIIADAYKEVGKNGVVTADMSSDNKTYYEVTSGLKVDRGFHSPYYVTDPVKQVVLFEKPYILITDQKINKIEDIEHLLEFCHAQNRPLFVVGEIDDKVQSVLNNNIARGNRIKFCHVIPPDFGYKRNKLMQDLATATGATYFSQNTGDDVSICTVEDLGQAGSILSTRFSTIIYEPIGEAFELMQELNSQIEVETEEAEKEFLKRRVAILGGGVGIVYVGANSDLEQKEKRDRVDDAIGAVRSALIGGVLPGGGVALKDIACRFPEDIELNLGERILRSALLAPMDKICSNAGLNVPSRLFIDGYGIDVNTCELSKMEDCNILDPTNVVKSAVKNAISVAGTILNTDTVITNIRPKQ